jgi:hypothetical protein
MLAFNSGRLGGPDRTSSHGRGEEEEHPCDELYSPY